MKKSILSWFFTGDDGQQPDAREVGDELSFKQTDESYSVMPASGYEVQDNELSQEKRALTSCQSDQIRKRYIDTLKNNEESAKNNQVDDYILDDNQLDRELDNLWTRKF